MRDGEQLACSIIFDQPIILVCCLALSLFSTFLTLPFLLLISSLLSSSSSNSSNSSTASNSPIKLVIVLFYWFWSTNLLRGVQKVCTAGIVGEWYFLRFQSLLDPSESATKNWKMGKEVLGRATGVGLGSILLCAAILSPVQLLLTTMRVSQLLLNKILGSLPGSSFLPLKVITFALSTVQFGLGFLLGGMELMNGWILIWVGLKGDGVFESRRRIFELLNKNGTISIGDSNSFPLSSPLPSLNGLTRS